MAATFKPSVLTPERAVFDGVVEYVEEPGGGSGPARDAVFSGLIAAFSGSRPTPGRPPPPLGGCYA